MISNENNETKFLIEYSSHCEDNRRPLNTEFRYTEITAKSEMVAWKLLQDFCPDAKLEWIGEAE